MEFKRKSGQVACYNRQPAFWYGDIITVKVWGEKIILCPEKKNLRNSSLFQLFLTCTTIEACLISQPTGDIKKRRQDTQ